MTTSKERSTASPVLARPTSRRRNRRGHRSSLRPRQSQSLAQLHIQLLERLRIILQKLPRILTALSNALALIAIPSPALLHQVLRHPQIDQVALFRDALTVNNVELRLAKRWRHLVLHDLDLGAVPRHHVAVFNRRNAPNIRADARIKLQRAPARGRFR